MTTYEHSAPRSRLQAARDRASDAKAALVLLAGAGFVAAAVLARAHHPATAATVAGSGSASTSASSGDVSSSGDDFGFQPGSFSSSSGFSSTSTHAS